MKEILRIDGIAAAPTWGLALTRPCQTVNFMAVQRRMEQQWGRLLQKYAGAKESGPFRYVGTGRGILYIQQRLKQKLTTDRC